MSKKIEEKIKDTISGVLENFYGDYNDNITRKLITTQVNDFLESLAEEVYNYEIVCNDTNNSAKDIDENKLNADIYTQYSPDEEFKHYVFIMSREGADFSELINQTEDVDG